MKEFIKSFPTLASADGHNIDAPFLSVIHTDGNPIFLRCTAANKKIAIEGGQPVIEDALVHFQVRLLDFGSRWREDHFVCQWNSSQRKYIYYYDQVRYESEWSDQYYYVGSSEDPVIINCVAEPGMTLAQWLDSEYNVAYTTKVRNDSQWVDSARSKFFADNTTTYRYSNDWKEAMSTVITEGMMLHYAEFNQGLCLAEDTPIMLADGTTKMVQDITYDDNLMVWDFDKGCYGSAKPLWIKAVDPASFYWTCKFDNGLELNLVGTREKSHRVFNVDDQTFDYPQDCVGKRVYTLNGIATLVSCEIVEKPNKSYNIITDYHMNLFANNVLTSCRYSNVYEIEDMKYVHDGRPVLPASTFGLPEEYYHGLRLGVQRMPIEDTIKYVHRLMDCDIKNSKQA